MGNKFFGPFLWVVTGCGTVAFLYSCFRLDITQLDSHFALLAGMTLILTSRISVPIPRFISQISVSDTFVFLILLLYGGAAAVVIGALEALLSSLRFSRRPRIMVFNWASAALSIFITSSVLQFLYGSVVALRLEPITAAFAAAICTMALVHYASNSGIVAIAAALKTDEP